MPTEIVLLDSVGRPTIGRDCYSGRYLAGFEAVGQFLVFLDGYGPEQCLYGVRPDPLWPVLFGLHLSVSERRGEHVGQRVIGLGLRFDFIAVALPSADDELRPVERIEMDRLDGFVVDVVTFGEFDDPLNGGLGIGLRDVPLAHDIVDPRALGIETDGEFAGDDVLPPFLSLEQVRRPLAPTAG